MRAVIILKTDPTLNRTFDSELTFWKDFFGNDVNIYLYSESKRTIVKKLKDLYKTTNYIDKSDILISDFGDQVAFGGIITENQYKTYKIFSDHTNSGGLLFLRAADCEVEYIDLKQFLLYRESKSKLLTYFEKSEYAEKLYNTLRIDYDYVMFVKNGNPHFAKWYVKQSNSMRAFSEREEDDISIYPGDDIIFKINDTKKLYGQKYNSAPTKSFVHAAFFKSAGKKKESIFIHDIYGDDIDIYSIGLKNPENIKCNILEMSKPMIGVEFYQTLNKYTAYLFLGKGDKKNELKYVNKTIYDCYIANLPLVIYNQIDREHKLFPELGCYFEDRNELNELKEKLQDADFRKYITDKQRERITKFLKYENREY